jgi:hypothetical protein
MIIIRPYKEGDEEGIRTLFNVCFGKELSREEWRWKYQQSHLGSSAFIAEADGEVVAHYGGFRLHFCTKGTVLNAFQGCDVMTHPRYRAKIFSKKGIIVQTAEAFYRENPMEFIYGFPSERHGRLKALQLGFEKHHHITIMKKEKSHFRFRKNLLLRVEEGWNRIGAGEIDMLWAETRDSYPLSIEKTSRYIFWRYRDRPGRNYDVLTLRGFMRRDLKAYMVVKSEGNVLRVLDFFVRPSLDFRKLLSVLENLAIRKGSQYITFWVNPIEKPFEVLRSNGYNDDRDIPFIVKMFENSGISAQFFLSNYCYRHGDYDDA